MVASNSSEGNTRIDWVDLAKGLTILLVVVMHSTFNVEKSLGAEGFMHQLVMFAAPFRMPVFFAVAGLFAARAISKDWRTFLDRKFVHFFYFYFLWMSIQFIFKAPFFVQEMGVEGTALYYLASFVQPFGLMWFIYLLPIYFVILRLSQPLPMGVQFVLAIVAKFLLSDTGILVLDYFAKYYVFFLIGHFGRDLWFSLANSARQQKGLAVAGLLVWALANGAAVHFGYSDYLPVAIILGLVGFLAVIDLMAILPRAGIASVGIAPVLAYCGQRSLPIYLGFFLPMGVTRIVYPLLCEMCSVGTISFIVSLSSIVGAILMYEAVRWIGIGGFLYSRPQWARLPSTRKRLVPAE